MKTGTKRNPAEPNLSINCSFEEQTKIDQLNGLCNDRYRLSVVQAGVEIFPINQQIAISKMYANRYEEIRQCLNCHYGFEINEK